MSKQWYYAKRGGDRQGPVEESAIAQLVANGQIQAGDLVWSEGMPEWTPVESHFALHAPPGESQRTLTFRNPPPASPTPFSTPPPAAVFAGASVVPPSFCSWTKFCGVMNMIVGILSCLTCLGIIQGAIQIILGTSLLGAQRALREHDVHDIKLQTFFSKMHTFMVVQGIVWILTLASMVVAIVFGILFSGVVAAAVAEAMKQAAAAGHP
jgi:hypothetical protein